ncbi:hypothetical protein Aduo_016152 [Ancylostoma duodenale]
MSTSDCVDPIVASSAHCFPKHLTLALLVRFLIVHRREARNAPGEAICSQWDRLGQLATQRRTALKEAERVAERLDTLSLDFAKRAAPFNNWLDGAREDLADLVIVHEMKEIQELCAAHDQFKSPMRTLSAHPLITGSHHYIIFFQKHF